jgi:hypothetical protein
MQKFYLPAFDLVCTVPNLKSACLLQRGMLELLQYRGDCVKLFDEIEQQQQLQPDDNTGTSSFFKCLVGVATKYQYFASVCYEMPWEKIEQDLVISQHLEEWEKNYCEACIAFCRFDFRKATSLSVRNLRAQKSDVFSLRLLFISAYFISDSDVITTECVNMLQHYSNLMKNNKNCVVQVTIPLIQGWASFGLEESRTSLDRALELALDAIEQTKSLNKKCFKNSNNNNENSFSSFFDLPVSGENELLAKSILESAGETGFANVFAVHAVCHVHETRHDAKAGIKFLEDEALRPIWTTGIHLAKHVWWHFCLFYFEMGNVTSALETYSQHVGYGITVESDPFTLSDSSSLILRILMTHQIAAESSPWNLNSRLKILLREALETNQKCWEAFGENILNRNTKLVPFFHTHKQLTHVLFQRTEFCDNALVVKKQEKKLDETNNNFRAMTKRQVLYKIFDLLLLEDDEEVIRGIYMLSGLEGGSGDSVQTVCSLFPTEMGGSKAQRGLLQLLFYWVIICFSNSRQIRQDAIAKIQQDAFVFGSDEKHPLSKEMGKWFC